MQVQNKRWLNQYIQHINTKPELIIHEPQTTLTEQTKSLVQDKLKQFSDYIVELGSGSGMHLIELAKRNPTKLCIGFEIRYKRAFKTAEKAERDSLPNVLVLRMEASFLGSLFEPGSIEHLHVNYPDPWDKPRWLKNRMLNERSIVMIWDSLRPGGSLRYKTDHESYFDATLQALNTNRWNIVRLTKDLHNSAYNQDNIPTEFEHLFTWQGKKICFVEATKV